MSTDLIQHAFHGQAVRVVTDEHGEPWFIAKDVCAILGIVNVSDATARLDDDERGIATTDTLGGAQKVVTVSEAGVYGLVFVSRRPEAREFKRWVTHELLPEVRRTGSYGRPDVAQITRSDLARMVIESETAREAAEARAEILAPSAHSWDMLVEDTGGDWSMRDAAQILDRDPSIRTGQNRIGAYLRQIGWIDARGIPYQRHVDLGRINAKPQTRISHRTGERVACEPQVRITLKGLGALHKLMGGTEPLDVEGRHLVAVS